MRNENSYRVVKGIIEGYNRSSFQLMRACFLLNYRIQKLMIFLPFQAQIHDELHYIQTFIKGRDINTFCFIEQ